MSVVSFRDAECARTLLDLFLTAQRPYAVAVGLVQQHYVDTDGDCLALLRLHCQPCVRQVEPY